MILLNNLLSVSMEQILSAKIKDPQLVEKLHYLQALAKFPVSDPDASSPQLAITLTEDLFFTLFYHLRPDFPSGFSPSALHAKTLQAPLLSHIRATCSTDPFWM